MATLLENQLQAQRAPDREAELHNAQINERYRRLKEAENDQFAALLDENVTTDNAFGTTIAPEYIHSESQYAPVEHTHTKVDSSLFNVETLNRVIQNGLPNVVEEFVPTQTPVVAQDAQVQTEDVAYLSRFAKLVAAAFMVMVALLLTVICINTQVINNKTAQLAELEVTRQQLIQENVRLQQQISEAMSDEVIAEFARSMGMVQG